MLLIKKRWPVLTAAVAVLAYSANNYQIAGLEHLRIEPRSGANVQSLPAGNIASWDSTQNEILDWDIEAALRSAPAWNSSQGLNNSLSLGEKVALWQDKLQSFTKSGETASAGTNLYSAAPIPLPGDMVNMLGLPKGNPLVGANGLDLSAANIPSSVMTGADILPSLNLATATAASGKRLRIGSFNLQSLGPTKLAKPHVSEMLVKILRQYDIVALQAIQSGRDDILPILTERLNQSGRTYDYLIGPRVGSGDVHEQFAFVFDTSRVETDRYQLYTIEDPENLMEFDPMVAWFRAKEAPASRAFTFSVINVHLLSNRFKDERELLPSVIHAVEQDGRREDDWMIAGDVGGSPSELPLNPSAVRFSFEDIPTDVVGEEARSAIVFSATGTVEFTGRAGVFDFLQKFNLSLERALEVSDQLPVWAEFSVLEGGEPGRIAPVDEPSRVF